MNAFRSATERFGSTLSDVSHVLYGTTIATNAVLEPYLPRDSLVATAYSECVLEIGRHAASRKRRGAIATSFAKT